MLKKKVNNDQSWTRKKCTHSFATCTTALALMSVELDMLYTAEGSTIVCTIMWKDSLHSQRILHFIHIQKWSGVYTHIAQVHGHLVMYLHLSSALLCLLQQLHTAPTTTCAKEVKEVVQSMFCRRLTIGHTNNFLTSNQSRTACLYLLPNPQTCQHPQQREARMIATTSYANSCFF